MIKLELCTTYSSSSPVATITSIILCLNKHWITQVHLETSLKRTERERERERREGERRERQRERETEREIQVSHFASTRTSDRNSRECNDLNIHKINAMGHKL